VRSTDTIAGFRIDPQSGLLSPIGLFAAEGSPRGFAIEPSGRFGGHLRDRSGWWSPDTTVANARRGKSELGRDPRIANLTMTG
jgi:6-phosphogluconolactonase